MHSTWNPSSKKQRAWVAALSFGAMLIALYLGFYQWALIQTAWDPFFQDGTKNVLTSDVSYRFTSYLRIPDAMLGAVAYFSDVVFAIAGSERRWQERPWLVLIFGINIIPLGLVSFTLVLLQGIIVQKWCFLCLLAAAISLTLIFLAYGEVRATMDYLYEIKKRGSWKNLWWIFWGFPNEIAIKAGDAVLKKRGNYVG